MDVFFNYEGIKFFMKILKILDSKNDHLRRLDDDKLYSASFIESTY